MLTLKMQCVKMSAISLWEMEALIDNRVIYITDSVCVCVCVLVTQSCLTLWDPMDCSPPLFKGFSRPEYGSRKPLPSPGDLPDPGRQPVSPEFQADSLPSEPLGKPLYTQLFLSKPKVQEGANWDAIWGAVLNQGFRVAWRESGRMRG